MKLSLDRVLVYVLRESGCAGKLSCGSIERHGSELKVYSECGEYLDYISGGRMRSWCVYGADRKPITGWCAVHDIDSAIVASVAA